MIPIAKVTRGRRGLYDEWLTKDGLLQIEGWARDGLTNEQIAHNIGVTGRTFCKWAGRFESISSALKKGKAPVDIEVENALLKRALGYDAEETVTEIYKEADGKEKQHIRKIRRHIPGDTTAMIFWLKNRRSDRWRNSEKLEFDKFEHQKAMDKEKMEILRSKAGVVNAEDETEANDIMMGYSELFTDPVSDRTITDIVQAIDDNSAAPAPQADGKKDQ